MFLAAFLVKNEMKKPGPGPISGPPKVQAPEAGPTPQLNVPPNQEPSGDLKAPAIEARPAALPSTHLAKHRSIRALRKTLRASKTPRAVLAAPAPRAATYPSREPLVRTPAPVSDAAASANSSAHVAPPVRAAASGIPAPSVPSSAGSHPNAPAQSALNLSAIDHGLAARGNRPASAAKVASVGLPAMQSGVVKPKAAVTPIAHKIEFVPRPPVKVENCGDDKVFVACPTLKVRYDTPYTSDDP